MLSWCFVAIDLKKITPTLFRLENYKTLLSQSKRALSNIHGDKMRWDLALSEIKKCQKGKLSLEMPYISISGVHCDKNLLKNYLSAFLPWRKGPYKIDDLIIDSEWCGDLKWQRVAAHIDLENKVVLDVGSGNGYFSYHIALSGAKLTLALEPFLLFVYQFYALYELIKKPPPIALLPLRLENISSKTHFDVIFSMGVLYHQKSPIEHLLRLKKLLTEKGVLILETLIVEGNLGYALMPKNRYACMANVWFLPSIDTLISYLQRCGFGYIKILDVSKTSKIEQHRTPWLSKHAKSLEDFLDSKNDAYTIEAYPAPKRALCFCKKGT